VKLPISLHIESDSIWTTYRAERDKIEDVQGLKAFVKRWENLLNKAVQEELLNDEILARIKKEDIPNESHIRDTAYFKWEKAGRPPGDGFSFWLQAEQEMNAIAGLVAELVIPYLVLEAMMISKQHVVPLNCAFIQKNGGLGAFEW
jgi:hypothetical protein